MRNAPPEILREMARSRNSPSRFDFGIKDIYGVLGELSWVIQIWVGSLNACMYAHTNAHTHLVIPWGSRWGESWEVQPVPGC